MTTTIKLEEKVKTKGQEVAEELKIYFRERGIYVINLIGSPGSGKTSLLESLAPDLRGRTAVIEGDLQTDKDKLRIERAGLPAYQLNTLGACHLDAKMIRQAVDEFSLEGAKILFIENVGNLVCPASFVIGEDVKVAVVSVTEGDDKPAKYPTAIRVSSAMVITKMDLLPYTDCHVDQMEADAHAINPQMKIFKTSMKTGEGMKEFLAWIEESAAAK
ncbi:MAG: hydrogenase accessory protein HypB [Candidatus Omnitrophota bacterium]|jgi:hydrogenase nickel incorporation protein HypB|nr:MAG: hydrogenase accessory protein HypB [Candidatus Omnitrophota bacterium]